MTENICDGNFWDLNVTWYTQTPHFTSCFEDVVFTSSPCILFSIILFLSLFLLPRHNPLPWRWLNILKFILSISLLFISILWCSIIYYEKYYLKHNIPNSSLLASSSRVVVFILVSVAMLKHRSRGVITSTTLSLLWIVLTLCGILLLRSCFLDDSNFDLHTFKDVKFVLSVLYYPVIFIQLFLSIFTDARKISPLHEKNILDELSFLANTSFLWFTKYVYMGRKRLLTVSDLSFWHTAVTTQYSYACLEKHWKHYLGQDQEQNPSLGWALCKAFSPWIAAGVILDLVSIFTGLLSPLVLDRIIDFTHDDFYAWRGYFYAILIFSTDLLTKNIFNNALHFMFVNTNQVQLALMSAVFRKNLRLSTGMRKEFDSGALMNLLSVDVKRLQWFSIPAASLISAPLRIVLVMTIMWQYLGISTLSGVGVIILVVPLSYLVARQGEKFSDKQMKVKDIRQKYMNELLNGIKILKLYAWENPFAAKVLLARKEEIKWIFYNLICFVVTSLAYYSAPFLISAVAFATYILIDRNHTLDPTRAFVTLTLMDQLRYALFDLPDAISDIIQFQVSLKRLRKYFRSENTDENMIGNFPDKGDVLSLRNITLGWTANSDPTIRNVTLHVPKGKLVAVVGQVGAGKSSLLSGILGEMYKQAGDIDVEGSIAYVPQTPWILNRSLKDNILLVKHLKEDKYNRVLDLCCLRTDLEILPAGDKTEIGEKGVNLSGGQKLRVSLAQAVYQDKDIYLLDDPLSAVDVHVGKSLFNDVIGNTGVLKKKTRILVTHDVSVLPNVDLIVSMKDGSVDEIGTYSQLIENNGSFKNFLQEHSTIKDVGENLPPPDKNLSVSSGGDADYLISTNKQSINAADEDKEKDHRLTDDENMEIGGVHRLVYWRYVKRLGWPLFIFATFWYIAYVSFQAAANIWVTKWTSDEVHNGTSYLYWRLEVYGALGVGQVLTIFLASTVLALGSNRAAISYHKNILDSVLKSPMQFFDSTPMGRVVNRFTTDLDTLDIQLFYKVDGWLKCFFSTIVSFIIIGMNVPIFVAALVPLGFVYYNIQRLHLTTYRQIRRLESTNISPIYSLFLESIQGVSSISAYNIKNEFIESFDQRLDTCFMCLFNSCLCGRWLNFWLELCGSSVLLVTTLAAINNRHSLNPAVVGLIITYALSVTDNLKWLVRMNSDLEDKSISIERVEEYCHLKPEADWYSSPGKLDNNWPENGNILFDNYSTRYRENLDLVLKQINLSINENEKVGIIGRTGAGKSSITLALFRIIEPASGTIYIDNVDVSKIGLHDLRQRLTIIPQDPVLFTGSIRINLDPNGKFTDYQLWKSLEKAHLKSFVSNLGEGLDYKLDESGSNLSSGQRQLVCLARALLKNTKILVMDEATASVDMETDSLIQNTIRTAFDTHTVITIAHRLHTVMDYDKIVVMENGNIAEVGSPSHLLQDTKSKFYEMNKEAGLL